MAVPDLSATNSVGPRLDYLLQRARSVKPGTAINPPLHVPDLVPENESLLGEIEGESEVRFLAVETAAKSIFYQHLVSKYQSLRRHILTNSGINKHR